MATHGREEVLGPYALEDGIYLLGSTERGVTVYKQQVRALNLVWALSARPPRRLAIVGGGIAGLTAAAAALLTFPDAEVHLFERRADLCPFQQGSDNRWLHPRIYDWPRKGSRKPSAGLPVLNWHEGRASDVSHAVLREFSLLSNDRLQLRIEVTHLRVASRERSVEWIGREATLDEGYCCAIRSVGTRTVYDTIILAVGFGIEARPSENQTPSYWRNDMIAQPILDGRIKRFLVSGYGDGGLIDLCRLTVERFRQDRIVYELFPSGALEKREQELATLCDPSLNLWTVLQDEDSRLAGVQNHLRRRLRKDTSVMLHIGRGGDLPPSFQTVFGPSSSVLNRLLTYLLYRVGAFSPTFTSLATAAAEADVLTDDVVCRYGTDALNGVLQIFDGNEPDRQARKARLEAMKLSAKQLAQPMWPLGYYPYTQRW